MVPDLWEVSLVARGITGSECFTILTPCNLVSVVSSRVNCTQLDASAVGWDVGIPYTLVV